MVGFKQLKDDDLSEQCVMLKQPKLPEGVRVPLFCFGNRPLLDRGPLRDLSWFSDDEDSVLDALLLAEWEDRAMKGICQYDVTTSEIKTVEGRKKFLGQLNEGWNADRLITSEVSTTFEQVDTFELCSTKHEEELLFCVARSDDTNPELIASSTLPENGVLIFINASAVEYGHVFLVPYCSNSFYQLVDASCLELAFEVSVGMNNCHFRVFYDCLPTAAHLYFQACYFPSPLAVEFMPTEIICGNLRNGIQISVVTGYPVKTLLFESNHKFKKLTEVLVKLIYFLQERGISYNLLISDCGKRTFLFLQGQKLKSSGFLSAWECGGYFLFKSRTEFDLATEKTILKRLSSKSIDDETFKAVKVFCHSIA